MRTIARLGLGLGVAVILAGSPASAVAANAKNAAKRVYQQYCAACHGSEGKGDGVVSGFMRPKASDLTELAKKNGGKFPYVETMKVIDGRTSVRAHGDADMPGWGEVMRPEASMPLSKSAEIRGKVQLITDYIESIQKK